MLACRFSQLHSFEKPNDPRALALMDLAAKEVLREVSGKGVAEVLALRLARSWRLCAEYLLPCSLVMSG